MRVKIILGVFVYLIDFGVGFSWNNGLREAVVSKVCFLFLSTFFIQCY